MRTWPNKHLKGDISQFNKLFLFLGRLKLRFLEGDDSQLVFYSRDDQDGPKLSDYSIARISKPDELLVTLGQALGIRGEVSVLKFGTIKRFWNLHFHILVYLNTKMLINRNAKAYIDRYVHICWVDSSLKGHIIWFFKRATHNMIDNKN